jgi:hypothetical protein
MMEYFFPPGEGTPIHCERKDFVFLHGSKHDASTARIVLVGNLSLTLPINLLNEMGLGGDTVLFWCFPLEDFFPFFFPPGISQMSVGFSSFGSFA